MPALTAKLFRDYFGGSWIGRITKNGEFQREIVFNWPELSGKFSSLGTEPGRISPPTFGILDNTRQVAIAGWRSDSKSWHAHWHNEFGGYGELRWTSHDIVDDLSILYGSLHECKQENDDATDHIAMCELFDHNNFKYTTKSFRKGVLEIEAKRIRTGVELNTLLENQAKTALSFVELCKM
jgi:hypothetical protein